jgi:hypothetical protein
LSEKLIFETDGYLFKSRMAAEVIDYTMDGYLKVKFDVPLQSELMPKGSRKTEFALAPSAGQYRFKDKNWEHISVILYALSEKDEFILSPLGRVSMWRSEAIRVASLKKLSAILGKGILDSG